MKFELVLSRDPFAAVLRFASGPAIPSRICEDGQNWMGLVGRIYGLPDPDLEGLLRRLERSEAALEFAGRFIFVHAEKKTGRLRIWTDKYRLLGVSITQRGGQTRIGNFPQLQPGDFKLADIDSNAVHDLLELGYIIPPATLFKDERMLAGFTETFVGGSIDKVNQTDWRSFWPCVTLETNPPQTSGFFDIFRMATNRLVGIWSLDRFRLSSGVDSRLLCACLSADSLKHLNFEVVCAPYLDEQSDRDVLGAKMVARALDVPISVVHWPAKSSAYFAHQSGGPALSGLYGGEFLGGVMFSDGPAVATPTMAPEWIGSGAGSESRRRFAAEVAQFGPVGLLASVYLGAYRSTIYRSVRLSWSSPSQLGLAALSPFSEQEVLDFILNQSESTLRSYGLYADLIARYVPLELKSIPFSSPIVGLHPSLPGFVLGRDPKFRPHLSEEADQQLDADFVAALSAIGIQIIEPSTVLHERLLNLQNAIWPSSLLQKAL